MMRTASLLLAGLFSLPVLAADALPLVEIYKSPYCGCCGAWAEHMEKAGFQVETHLVDDVDASRARLGMPQAYGSCHTAKVGGYLLEGHVPAVDVKRLLKEKPKAVGLAVPGMPPGSPGMEGPPPQAYDTMLVSKGGTATVYQHHGVPGKAEAVRPPLRFGSDGR